MVTSVPNIELPKKETAFIPLLGDHQNDVADNIVRRPWGSFESLVAGEGYQVKRIVVSPGKKLSLQYHHHRSEHWTIVQGDVHVHLNEDIFMLKPDESIYIPLGAVHRLENRGTEDVVVIEVQTGRYLGEDDIVRVEDDFGRCQ